MVTLTSLGCTSSSRKDLCPPQERPATFVENR